MSCAYLWTSDKGKTRFRDGATYINFNDGTLNMNLLDYDDYLRVLPVRVAKTPKHELIKKPDTGTGKGSYGRSRSTQRLRELKKLKDDDLLTDEEYEEKRRAIIDAM
jgi:hypothetical protein